MENNQCELQEKTSALFKDYKKKIFWSFVKNLTLLVFELIMIIVINAIYIHSNWFVFFASFVSGFLFSMQNSIDGKTRYDTFRVEVDKILKQ